MGNLVLSEIEQKEVFALSKKGGHAFIRQKSHVILLRSKGHTYVEIVELCGISQETIAQYTKGFKDRGIAFLKELKWKGQPCELDKYIDVIKKELDENPPRTISEARDIIHELTGIARCPTQVRIFLKKIGFKFLKTGSIPGNGKADDAEKEAQRNEFKKKAYAGTGKS